MLDARPTLPVCVLCAKKSGRVTCDAATQAPPRGENRPFAECFIHAGIGIISSFSPPGQQHHAHSFGLCDPSTLRVVAATDRTCKQSNGTERL